MFCPLLRLAPVLAIACATAASAATVRVTVLDTSAAPVTEAVVLLAPQAGSMAVKPMNGIQISQMQRQFNPRVTVVTVGTAVTFPNFDTVRHHVYSFSQAKAFELKLYAGTPAAPVVFDKPGIAVLGCNIHDRMAAWVVVVDTPLHARSAAAGKAQLDDVPAGSYRLLVWHPGLVNANEPAAMPLIVGSAEVNQRVVLDLGGPSK